MYLNLGHTINEMQDDAKEAPVCALFKNGVGYSDLTSCT